MGYTNFPHGVTSFGIPQVGSGNIPATTGSYFFVHNGTGSNSNPGTDPANPVASIDYAVGLCTANKGDVIVVMPGHTEDIGAAAGIVVDVAGVTIVGLGEGTLRPTITYSATASDMDIDADNVTIDNLYFDLTGIDAVVAAIDVNAANFTLKNCEILMADSGGQATSALLTAAAANYMKILNCKILAPNAGANEAINLTGATTGVEIKNCWIAGDFAVAAIHNPTGNVLTNLLIQDCVLKNDQTGDFALELVSACTGALVRNYYHTDGLATAVDPGSCFSFECYATNAVDKSGALTPAVST